MTTLRCSFCRNDQAVQIRSDLPVLEQVLGKTCRTCHRTGSLQLVQQRELALPPAVRSSIHGPPDDLSDEELLEDRNRTWKAP